MFYILADDLTGANDTGVQFAQYGYSAMVVIVTESIPGERPYFEHLPLNIEALVCDTESRSLDPASAQQRIRGILQSINPAPEDTIYKKVDSTLRGNPGAEIEACLQELHKEICLFAPAFPAMQRTTVAGCLLVERQPLGQTAYYAGNLPQHEASFIPNLLKQQTTLPVARLDLSEIVNGQSVITERLRQAAQAGERIVVADAVNDGHLRHLVSGGQAYGHSVLYAGSAGLANALAEAYYPQFPPASSESLLPPKLSDPLLVVNGSRRMVGQQQVDYLKTHLDVVDVALDLEQLCAAHETYIAQQAARAVQALVAHHHTIIRPDPQYLDEHRQQALLETHQFHQRQLETSIQASIGELVSRIINQTGLSGLLIIGGDTAVGVCAAAGIHQLQVRQEVLPGVPLCIGMLPDFRELTLVTKAGGFGDEKTLYMLMNRLKN